jgi:hypothetical protein
MMNSRAITVGSQRGREYMDLVDTVDEVDHRSEVSILIQVRLLGNNWHEFNREDG